MTNFWFCEVGPGWKPDAEALAEDTRHNLELRRQRVAHQAAQAQARAHGHGIAHPEAMQAAYDSMYPMLGWVPSNNPFERHWQVVPLRAAATASDPSSSSSSPSPSSSPSAAAATTASVDVDMSAVPWLSGREPLAIRLGWPLFGIPYSPADTCCVSTPSHAHATPTNTVSLLPLCVCAYHRLRCVCHAADCGRSGWAWRLHSRELPTVFEDVRAAS